MKTIWKFPIDILDEVTVSMPKGAEILSVQVQHGQLCLWAIVNSESKLEYRNFRIYGTGHPMDGVNQRFVGTIQIHNGGLVFHIFEVLP